ncbi:MAG: hypothetical protein KF841_14800 [Phycisphaerae bacterium]|nr:hypothetical protein [Phycisphaerae bacterium]
MLIVFVILGTLTLAGSLVGLLNAPSRAMRFVPFHVVSLGLVGAAWWFTHQNSTGRVCLFVGAAVEAIAWMAQKMGNGRTKVGRDSEKPPVKGRFAGDGPGNQPGRPSAALRPAREQPDESAFLEASWTPEAGEIAAVRARARAGGVPSTEGHDALGVGKVFIQQNDQPDMPTDSVDSAGPDGSTDPANGSLAAGTIFTEGVEPDQTPMRPLSLRTEVLFSDECRIPPSVFVASLRRSGRRDASADEEAGDEPMRIRVGDAVMEYQIEKGSRESSAIEETLVHFEHPAEFSDRVRNHAARVVLTSRYDYGTPRDTIVRLHHFAHAALTEFAPVMAAFWPDARMLTPVEQLAGLLEYSRSPVHAMWRTCAHIRGFALAGENEGMLLFDSVGLHAFGLPDVQVIAPSANEAAARSTVDLIAERIFQSGCDLPHGTEYTASDGLVWRVNYTRSAFVPDREVVQMALKAG